MALTGFASQVKPYTKSTPERIEAMALAIEMTGDIPGDIVECGVWKGGNIILARKMVPERVCWLYDTFEGMTEPQEIDVNRRGFSALDRYRIKIGAGKKWVAASFEDVCKGFEQTGTWDESKLRFVVGRVEQTLLEPENLPERIAVLRLDTDWYASTKVELEVLYPRLAPGGILIIDDYGHWMGAQRAVKEYFADNMPSFTWIDYTAVSMVKPC